MSVSYVKSRRRSRIRKRMVCWFVAVLLLTGTALADEPLTAESRSTAPVFRFHTAKLAPRVSMELESLSAFQRVSEPGQRLQEHMLFEQLTASVRRDIERVARKAVKNYLIDVINLDRGIDSIKSRVRGESVERVERRGGMGYRLGFHSGLPVVGVSYDAGPGKIGVKVSADGAVGLRYRDSRMRQADFSASFDGDERFEIRALLAF